MTVKLKEWGNSLGIRIPKAFAMEMGVDKDAELEMKLCEEGASLIIKKKEPTYKLSELLVQCTEADIEDMLDWGGPVGNEEW